jgi:hypothetical protein
LQDTLSILSGKKGNQGKDLQGFSRTDRFAGTNEGYAKQVCHPAGRHPLFQKVLQDGWNFSIARPLPNKACMSNPLSKTLCLSPMRFYNDHKSTIARILKRKNEGAKPEQKFRKCQLLGIKQNATPLIG